MGLKAERYMAGYKPAKRLITKAAPPIPGSRHHSLKGIVNMPELSAVL
jgi:hypothetical protein